MGKVGNGTNTAVSDENFYSDPRSSKRTRKYKLSLSGGSNVICVEEGMDVELKLGGGEEEETSRLFSKIAAHCE